VQPAGAILDFQASDTLGQPHFENGIMAIVPNPAVHIDGSTRHRAAARRQLFAGWFRRTRFNLISRVLLPLAIVPLHLLVKSWRTRGPSEETWRQTAAAPRVVVVTYHGMFLHLLAFAHRLRPYGRNLVLIASPSLDGRLVGQVVEHFGLKVVYGSSRSQAVSGSLEFARSVKAGDLGVLAADGPRGPACVVKPGFVRLAAAIDAHLLLATTSAGAGIRFGSWDRSHLPLPFSRVELKLKLLGPPMKQSVDRELIEIQSAMLQAASEMRSPILPPGLAQDFEPDPIEPAPPASKG